MEELDGSVDHSKIDYKPFEASLAALFSSLWSCPVQKCFYEEEPEVFAMTEVRRYEFGSPI
eukprot:755238-Hanusia_phi.AAC.3